MATAGRVPESLVELGQLRFIRVDENMLVGESIERKRRCYYYRKYTIRDSEDGYKSAAKVYWADKKSFYFSWKRREKGYFSFAKLVL